MSTEQNNGKPAVPPKRNLLNNRRIRLLLSLLGAVIAWMAVTIVVQPGTTTTIYNVPVDFTYDSAAYTSRGLRILIRRACNAVLEYEHFDDPAEISVTFVDNAAIAELNNQYRNKPMPTDVLSFPLGENGVYDVDENNGCKMLGDIVISMERAQEQATLYGHPLQREVAFLTVHSMLHLLGYDHENGGLEAMRMREKEEAVLTQLGLPRTVSYTE